jgi:hypothetical protein
MFTWIWEKPQTHPQLDILIKVIEELICEIRALRGELGPLSEAASGEGVRAELEGIKHHSKEISTELHNIALKASGWM